MNKHYTEYSQPASKTPEEFFGNVFAQVADSSGPGIAPQLSPEKRAALARDHAAEFTCTQK